jgi:hypothetical protein
MARRKKIVNWLNLRDNVLTRIATEENPGVLKDLLLCYQEIIKIREHEKASNKARTKIVTPVLTQENNEQKPIKLASPRLQV